MPPLKIQYYSKELKLHRKSRIEIDKPIRRANLQ